MTEPTGAPEPGAGDDGDGGEAAVRVLLGLSSLRPPDAEVTAISAGYAGSRAAVAALYRVPGVRYAEPATVFRARP